MAFPGSIRERELRVALSHCAIERGLIVRDGRGFGLRVFFRGSVVASGLTLMNDRGSPRVWKSLDTMVRRLRELGFGDCDRVELEL